MPLIKRYGDNDMEIMRLLHRDNGTEIGH